MPRAFTLLRLPFVMGLALLLGASGPVVPQDASRFGAQVSALSEQGGYFDTDNLISNERSYLDVLAGLDRAGVRGGAYVGVGPDQNFSYIAHIRPSIAFIVDIRRDNLLLHLLFKALFEQARTRIDYLALLFGRPSPRDGARWSGEPVERLAAYIDGTDAEAPAPGGLDRRTRAAIARFGVALSDEDFATIGRFHRRFVDGGLGLRFESTGRAPQMHYPTYRDLLLAVDSRGRKGNFLATEEGFQFVKSLQARNLIVPVVGDLAGPRALRAIGQVLKDRRQPMSAFYTSNVEFYLARSGSLDRFLENLAQMSRMRHAVVIRSVFGGFNRGSGSVLEPVDAVVAARRP
ncbi:MAG: hypothetical protein M3Q85_02375 [Acidobacteriota bacterium]|nr:hypothetical protein [Acidobacteriota bacterium]